MLLLLEPLMPHSADSSHSWRQRLQPVPFGHAPQSSQCEQLSPASHSVS